MNCTLKFSQDTTKWVSFKCNICIVKQVMLVAMFKFVGIARLMLLYCLQIIFAVRNQMSVII